MAHTYTNLLYHCAFSTKNRRSLIADNVQAESWAYMGGIARSNDFKALAVGGIDNHCHILLVLPPTLPVAKAVQLIKAGSSKWMREHPDRDQFAWQEAYGAFTIGESQVPHTMEYIRNQKEHHARVSFEDEFRAFLRKNQVAFDEQYVFG
ncbi:MAG TPA: IS200/IS605 family transposase [Terriglobales bacterium]|nr:IS200/IS605 family transposase [Terriglobales bacterium]